MEVGTDIDSDNAIIQEIQKRIKAQLNKKYGEGDHHKSVIDLMEGNTDSDIQALISKDLGDGLFYSKSPTSFLKALCDQHKHPGMQCAP